MRHVTVHVAASAKERALDRSRLEEDHDRVLKRAIGDAEKRIVGSTKWRLRMKPPAQRAAIIA
jgi:hypothetical protein